ncbi:potassium channel family protein [Deinococcus cellulosilyticus]|uniref:Potassium channel domain-containing protein n=1 Tax=Deinococcus cellulosilyticus (strain DSM 18568 / NBRC 106333 / KACC 11606 / 5516J-15) TaxID=1223518 RepID=A0A511N7X8_DEIC1|nr:potassium channel family protein [Deinococcus cellulosilyticus]GEM48930.1 hypothetical protein DC3_45650 [Deinococcus cellulosilyticus NBRC 106333 = KACC 11606]
MDGVYPIIGTIILFLLAWDVFATVFIPRGLSGPFTQNSHHLIWRIWCRINCTGTPAARRRLSRLGPMLVILTVIGWALLLWLGFALIFYPHASGFHHGTRSPSDWISALYVSGYSVTTLGVGDIVPKDGNMRLLMILAAGSGFILISIAVTYLLSFYAALGRVTALAYEVHRFLGKSDGYSPVDVVITAITADCIEEMKNWLADIGTTLAQVLMAEQQYTLLNYFHEPDDMALPVALTDVLELTTICRSVLSPTAYPSMANGLITAGTERLTRGYFESLARKFGGRVEVSREAIEDRHIHFDQVRAKLEQAGVQLRDREEAWAIYNTMRQGWEIPCHTIRVLFGYPGFSGLALKSE